MKMRFCGCGGILKYVEKNHLECDTCKRNFSHTTVLRNHTITNKLNKEEEKYWNEEL